MSFTDQPIWWWLAVGVAMINLIAFISHARDKRAAIRGTRRTPEARLHLWELLGGWPGAILAMCLFRHKVRKGSYLLITFLIVAFWITGVGVAIWSRSRG